MIRRAGFLIALAFAGPAFAADIDAGTQTAVRSIITKQIDAFGHADAATAEGFASPALKQKFGDPATFMQMVQRGYRPLINPRSTKFAAPEAGPDGGVVQNVTIVATDGSVWTAIYSFAQMDGRWEITGCVLLHAPETSA